MRSYVCARDIHKRVMFANYIFANTTSFAKFAKISSRENFQVHGKRDPLSKAPFTRKRFGVVTFSSSESRFRFWCVYTETFLCLLQTTKVLLSSDQDGDEQLSSDNGPDSEREGTKCKGEGRDSERGRSDV